MSKRSIFMAVLALIILIASWLVIADWQKKQTELFANNQLGFALDGSETIKITASLFPWYDLAKEIGGERAEVTLLLPPGMEPHAFEPTPRDMILVSESDLFLYTGSYLEPWAQDILDNFPQSTLRGLALGEALATIKDEDEGLNGLDPHIWLSPVLMMEIAERLTGALNEVDPLNQAYYTQNLLSYQQSLEKLDQDYSLALESCQQRQFIYAGHYAFGYLAARYNLQYEAAQGFSPDAESSPQTLANLTDLLRSSQADYIFAEELDNPQLAESLASELGIKILPLNSAHNVSKANLKAGLSYEEIMRANLEQLIIGLKCQSSLR